jgi:signal transduction histidine kinase
MRLSQFIEENLEPILVDWEAFARTMIPPSETMSVVALRDHAEEMLRAIAADLKREQTEDARYTKSKGAAKAIDGRETSAAAHGALRQLAGFNLVQLGAEYRGLRATVLRLWRLKVTAMDETTFEDMMRFNEAIDQALAESVASYSERVSTSRDTFLAVLGHDLRSPLSAMAGSIHLVRRGKVGAAGREQALQVASRSVASMNDMITDLLEYTRTRLGKGIEVVRRRGELSALCREVLEELQAAHPSREFESDISTQIIAMFDAARMRQVLTNLLANAVYHGEPASPVGLHLRRVGEVDELEVTNRGMPIPPEALQVIFDPLVQVPGAPTELHERPATSLGLGLFIAREIVNAHGGRISVTSTEADGTAFRVVLPHSAGE